MTPIAKPDAPRAHRAARLVPFALMALGVGAGVALAVAVSHAAAQDAPPAARTAADASVMMWGFISAALSTGIAALGAAYAVSRVGAAALGTMGERPEIAGRALIFLGLAEGVAIYGLIVAIMILGRLP
jgi:V/A-type H+-transporting ATPase subunit K